METRVALFIIVAALFVLGGGFIFWYEPEPTLGPTSTAPVPAGTAYRSAEHGIAVDLPSGMTVREYDEGAGAYTLIFENISEAQGFQIFAVPYAERTISDERFYADVPTGVREERKPTTVGVDHIAAVTFLSTDLRLGDTREVWFIHDGYLYEVMTLRSTGEWFEAVLASLKFI